MEVSGQVHGSATLTPKRNLRYPLDGRGGGCAQSRSGRCEVDKDVAPAGNQTTITKSSSQ
jgi:hypothetical protein